MSQFMENYEKMQAERAARAANGGSNGGQNFVKIGFFGSTKDPNGNRVKYMTKSGEAALVRINYGADPNELMGAWLHPAADGVRINNRPFQKVECLGKNCPICKGIAEGRSVGFGKATTRVFVPMVISYMLPNGTYTTPEPVAMDGASYMVEVLKQTMGDFGALRDHVFKLTRTGNGTDTRYSLSYIPNFDNENVITKASLDAFATFDVTKHSYWVKSEADINTFLATGAFPEVTKNETATTPAQPAYAAQAAPAYTAQPVYTAPVQPAYVAPTAPATPAPAVDTYAAAETNPFTATPVQAAPQAAPQATPVRQTPLAANAEATPKKDHGFSRNW